jgi:hypothetical protein
VSDLMPVHRRWPRRLCHLLSPVAGPPEGRPRSPGRTASGFPSGGPRDSLRGGIVIRRPLEVRTPQDAPRKDSPGRRLDLQLLQFVIPLEASKLSHAAPIAGGLSTTRPGRRRARTSRRPDCDSARVRVADKPPASVTQSLPRPRHPPSRTRGRLLHVRPANCAEARSAYAKWPHRPWPT